MRFRGFISWVSNQIRRLRTAVSNYNAAITRMENSGEYTMLPPRTSMAKEMQMISTRDELYKREGQLKRILKKNKPNAQVPMEYQVQPDRTEVVPRYMVDENKLAVRAENKRRNRDLHKIYPDFDSFDKVKKMTVYADKNLYPLSGNFFSAENFQATLESQFFTGVNYADRILEVWREYSENSPYYKMVVDDITWIAKHDPDYMELLLESNADEAKLHYYYPFSPDMTPFEMRQANISSFWADARAACEGIFANDMKDKEQSKQEFLRNLG